MKVAILALALLAVGAYAQDDEPITNGVAVIIQPHIVRATDTVTLLLESKRVIGSAVQIDTNHNVIVLWPAETNGPMRGVRNEQREVVENFAWFLNQIGSTQTVNQAIRNLKQGIQRKAKN